MIIVDSTVLIDIERGRDPIKQLLEQYSSEEIAISMITIQEMYVGLGVTLKKRGEKAYFLKRSHIEQILEDFVFYDINQAILERAGIKEGELLSDGITIDSNDLIIGATAEFYKADKIITRNSVLFDVWSIQIESYEI